MAPRVSAFGKRKPTATYVACRGCKRVYKLDELRRCPQCGTQYMVTPRNCNNKEGW